MTDNKSPISPTFCVYGWDQIATTPSGSYRVCCNSDPKNNKLLDQDGKILKFFKTEVDQIHTSPTLKKVRQEMLAGQWPETCIRCKRHEDSGILSARQVSNGMWYDADLDYDLETPVRARYADLRLSNLCNLKCRMCNPCSSNQWVDEWEKLYGKFSDDERNWLKKMSWPDHESSRRILREIVHNVDMIYFTGGEPTILAAHQYLIEYAVEQGLAKNIQLKYNTNLTNVPDRLVQTWSEFKDIRFNLSIDGIGELNDYIRYPSKWRAVEKNYQKILNIDETSASKMSYVIDIHVTIQNSNILQLGDILDYFLPGDGHDWQGNHVFLNVLQHPEQHNIRALPPRLKTIAVERIADRLDDPRLLQIKGMVDYMMAEDWSHLFPKFIDETQQLDKMRGQDIGQVIPEFKPYLNRKET